MAAKKNHKAPTAVPVTVNNLTSRSDEDAIEGLFADVVAGEHAGRRGVYEQTLTHDPETGYPATIAVRTRDAQNELLVVDYEDAGPQPGIPVAADTEKGPAPPPNLRSASSDDTGGECETCVYFDHTHCTAYPPLCVDPEWYCDHYKKSDKPDSDSQPTTMAEAGAEARLRLRAAK